RRQILGGRDPTTISGGGLSQPARQPAGGADAAGGGGDGGSGARGGPACKAGGRGGVGGSVGCGEVLVRSRFRAGVGGEWVAAQSDLHAVPRVSLRAAVAAALGLLPAGVGGGSGVGGFPSGGGGV